MLEMDKIRDVAVNVEAHVANVELDDGVRLRGCVFHENLCLIEGVGGGRSLLGSDFIECDNHCGVDGARYAEESTGNALHVRDAAFIKFRCGRGVGRVLHLGPIRRREPFVGRVLGARGHGVLEELQGFADSVGHEDFNLTSGVVPVDFQAAVLAAIWVDGD